MASSADIGLSPAAIPTLVENHRRFLRFLDPRVRRPEDAEEILQTAFVKAVEKKHTIRDEESVIAWFYRLLRNALVDYYRRNDFNRRAMESIAVEVRQPAEFDAELERTVCACVGDLIPTLAPQYAELLERVDVEGQSVPAAAEGLGITPNNAGVRLHRARAALKTRLEQICGTCAAHGCLDCTCSCEKPV